MKYGAKGERGRITPNSAINPIKFSAAEYFLRAVRNVRNGGGQRSTAAEIISRFLSRNYWYRFESTLSLSLSTEYKRGRMKLQVSRWRFNIVGKVWHNRVLTRRDKPRLAKNPTRAREGGGGNLRKLSFRRSDLSGSEGRCVDFQMIFESRVAISFLLQQHTLLAFFFFCENRRDLWFYRSLHDEKRPLLILSSSISPTTIISHQLEFPRIYRSAIFRGNFSTFLPRGSRNRKQLALSEFIYCSSNRGAIQQRKKLFTIVSCEKITSHAISLVDISN